MDGNYRLCYAVGYMSWPREGRGKLFTFPRNPARFVLKIIYNICVWPVA